MSTKAYLSVYPYLRSYEWYLFGPAERSAMLAERGTMARQYPDVPSSTVGLACFSLNDYERMQFLSRVTKMVVTTHRQNFLLPPRAHRSMPLAELL